ncbi:hypothetical protein RB614_27970 [Phytohabitans sp. ZYX-F-186]|uniref:Uncharacterized protein n=1 Tax=Phytohabitans maris TaxID=3071409 RepID=A0ABU0ZMV7_9ACTN|nr:hypothetical protein [Phytohabitans sp. ZYX-F-186]MDQ7908370.1 hypothetical protein [Phytohabitans sp. ZYX-F-186]
MPEWTGARRVAFAATIATRRLNTVIRVAVSLIGGSEPQVGSATAVTPGTR